jgi:scyllo-inositol 2-dehydrogenase (NADP+)
MRVVVAGLGVQGRKRLDAAGPDIVATVDPVNRAARYRGIADVPPDDYDATLVCTPDEEKIPILRHLFAQGKHALVEKPLLSTDAAVLEGLKRLAADTGSVCYTAYNHRFEPHFARMKETIESGVLGRVYLCRMFYGNGTARDVRDSAWRDRGGGVLTDLGSHLLDTALFWFGTLPGPFEVWSARRFENRAFDHALFGARGPLTLEMEATLLSWRNQFTADVFGERGSAHISSLCKWGPTTFTLRRRVLPSGQPPEEAVTLVQSDPTWALEYDHFTTLCEKGKAGNLDNDIVLNGILGSLVRTTSAFPGA